MKAIKDRLGRYLLNKHKENEKIKRSVTPFEYIKTIGVLYNAEMKENTKKIDKFCEELKHEGIKVIRLGYYDQKKIPEGVIPLHGDEFFSRKDIAWNGLPSKNIIGSFVNQEFDYLLNLYLKDIQPLLYTSANSKAKFRIGKYNEAYTKCYDFMVDTTKNDNIEHLMKQTLHYLKTLK